MILVNGRKIDEPGRHYPINKCKAGVVELVVLPSVLPDACKTIGEKHPVLKIQQSGI